MYMIHTMQVPRTEECYTPQEKYRAESFINNRTEAHRKKNKKPAESSPKL